MTFRQFAFNNVIRNKRLYAAYFLSSLFTVMVFFTFSIFAFHPMLSGEGMNSSVTQGMNVSAGIIYVFSFFFILYSMSSFLQSRKKEFGLLMMHGMSMRQIRLMVFLENMLIGLFATLGGIVLGLIFAKGILLLASNVLILEESLQFYVPMQAILLTLGSFIILFFIISLFVTYVLRSKKLIELMKSDKKSKGEPKANQWLTLMAIGLLGAGYAVALIAKGLEVLFVMVPVILVVTIGTYLLFTQLSVFVIKRLKRKDNFFWFKTNMILFSDLSFRMKDNARTFFMVAMVSTVAFSAIGTLFGFKSFLLEGTKVMNPTTFSYTGYIEENVEKDLALITNVFEEENIATDEEQMILHYYEVGHDRLLIASQSDYNRFARLIGEDEIEVESGKVRVVEFEGATFGQTDELLNETIELSSGQKLKPTSHELIYSRALPATDSYYVISDKDYEWLPSPVEEMSYYAWQLKDGNQDILPVAERIDKGTEFGFTARDYEAFQIIKMYSPILFVGLFIGLVFFVSAGSFLYFRLYMDLDEDKQKFRSIAKMGLTVKELRKVLTRQTLLLFFAPIMVALIHGAVALTALSHMFDYDMAQESITVLGVFLAIQMVYFFIVRFFYTKQIEKAIQ